MTFYREGVASRISGKHVDSYNYFYLFVETLFNVPSKTRQAVDTLSKNGKFVESIDQTLREPYFAPNLKKLSFRGITSWPADRTELIKEIVELRGHLRHHSMANAKRWDPSEQGKYAPEATFLSSICQDISKPITFDSTWENKYSEEFVRQAKETGHMAEIHITISMKDAFGIVREIGLDLSVPSGEPTAKLAQAALTTALERFDERSPGAALFGIRAWIKPRGPELFRYDLGPGVAR